MRFPTVDVTFTPLEEGEPDGYNVPRGSWGEPVTAPCLVSPASSTDMGADRPSGARVAYSVIVPKAVGMSLRGAKVAIPGEPRECRVVGDPKPYPGGSLPASWPFDRVAEVGYGEG